MVYIKNRLGVSSVVKLSSLLEGLFWLSVMLLVYGQPLKLKTSLFAQKRQAPDVKVMFSLSVFKNEFERIVQLVQRTWQSQRHETVVLCHCRLHKICVRLLKLCRLDRVSMSEKEFLNSVIPSITVDLNSLSLALLFQNQVFVYLRPRGQS